MKIFSTIFLSFILWVVLIFSFSCIECQMNKVIFQDPLNGEPVPGWRVIPESFIEHPIHGKVYLFKTGSL